MTDFEKKRSTEQTKYEIRFPKAYKQAKDVNKCKIAVAT